MKNINHRKVLADWLKDQMSRSKAVSTQTKLANKGGVSQSTVGRILREEVDTEFKTALELITAAHGTFDSFIADVFGLNEGITTSMLVSPSGRRIEAVLRELDQEGILSPEFEAAVRALADLAKAAKKSNIPSGFSTLIEEAENEK